jgi:hypothetical protein
MENSKGGAMMRTTKTTKLDLCLTDLEDIINEYLLKMGYSECYDRSFRWKVVNKPRPGGMYDNIDNHVFDGVEITVTEE